MLRKLLAVSIFTYCIFISQLIAKDTIMVSIPPQKYFVEQIAKDKFTVCSMLKDTAQSIDYTPTTNAYILSDNAIGYFKIGIYNEEKWIKKIQLTNKNIQLFDTNINVKTYKSDIYTWLDPKLVRIQAKNILNGLIKLNPENKDFYKQNYFKFVNRISRIDYQIRSLLRNHKKEAFAIFDPTWSYFTRRYELKQIEILEDPLDTSDENIMGIINIIKRVDTNILFIPTYNFPTLLYKQLSQKTKIILAPINDLDYNWENNILSMAKIIANQNN